MTGIYKITNPTGRIYIGQTVDIEKRWQDYKNLKNCKSQTKLYRSFLKHGVENHKFEIVEECFINQLNIRERYWQDHFDVLNGGLNCVLQKTNETRGEMSLDTKIKMSLFRLGNNNPMFGKKHSEKTKKSISSTLSSKEYSQFFKSGELNPMYNKKGKDSPTSKLVLDTQTGIFFDSVIEASEAYIIEKKSLANKLRGYRKNNTNLIYC